MSTHDELIDRYIAAWNEPDAGRRRALIARTWIEDATYVDPVMRGEGHAGIEAMIAAVHERFPGHVFTRTGGADEHNERLRFSWVLGAAGAKPVVAGTDFALVAGGRLSAVTGFFDADPAGS